MNRHAEQFALRTASGKVAEFDFAGPWSNELGSRMELAVDGAGNVSGRYKSKVSGTGAPTEWTDLAGTSSGDLIAFTVNWGGGAITSWVGHGAIGKDGPEIITLWQLVKNVPDIEDPEVQWKTVLAGADDFLRST